MALSARAGQLHRPAARGAAQNSGSRRAGDACGQYVVTLCHASSTCQTVSRLAWLDICCHTLSHLVTSPPSFRAALRSPSRVRSSLLAVRLPLDQLPAHARDALALHRATGKRPAGSFRGLLTTAVGNSGTHTWPKRTDSPISMFTCAQPSWSRSRSRSGPSLGWM